MSNYSFNDQEWCSKVLRINTSNTDDEKKSFDDDNHFKQRLSSYLYATIN